MEFDFRDWCTCPACDEREGVSTLAHGTDIVFECHGCGQISEYVLGDDVSLRGLDLEAIAAAADESTSD